MVNGFQGAQFIPRFQRKQELEQQAKQPFGRGLAEGVQARILGEIAQPQQRSQFELAQSLLKEQFKRSEPFRISTQQALSIPEQVQLINTLASGQQVTDADIGFRPRAAEKPSLTKKREAEARIKERKADLVDELFELGEDVFVKKRGKAALKLIGGASSFNLIEQLFGGAGGLGGDIGGGFQPAGGAQIRVRRKSDGATGTIPQSEFDPNIYQRL